MNEPADQAVFTGTVRQTKTTGGKRVNLTLAVTAALKEAVVAEAQKNGRSQSLEGERWLEERQIYRDTFARLGRTPEELDRELFNAAGHRLGWRRHFDGQGEVLLSPDHPISKARPLDGFVPIEPGDPETLPPEPEAPVPEVPEQEPLTPEQMTANIRQLQEQIARLESLMTKVAEKIGETA